MENFKVAVIAGDGIGPEVLAEGIKVLKAVAEMDGSFAVEFTEFPWGCEYYLKHGEMMEADGMEKLKVCIAYEYRGKRTEYAPLDAQGWEECTPVYLEFPGWSENTHGITEWDQLPPAARAYLRALEELAGCPISIVSTGPDRDHPMVLQDPWG